MLSDFFAVPSKCRLCRDTQETYRFVRAMDSLRVEDSIRGGWQKANWWMLIISERLPV